MIRPHIIHRVRRGLDDHKRAKASGMHTNGPDYIRVLAADVEWMLSILEPRATHARAAVKYAECAWCGGSKVTESVPPVPWYCGPTCAEEAQRRAAKTGAGP